MLKKIIYHWPLVFIIIFTFFFFYRLFFPISIFSTPGDIAYFNFPLKNFLSESLKNHQLPMWSNLTGTGFPILADGPMGTFYIPNLILFYFLPPTLAFNISYVLIFLIASISMYLFCREVQISKLASVYSSLAFSFSGFFISRIIHTSFIQVAAFLPLQFWLLEKYLKTDKKLFLLFFALLMSQLIFAGYPQGVLYSVIFSIFYVVFRSTDLNKSKKSMIKKLSFIILFLLISVIISAAQILPSNELRSFSTRASGLPAEELYLFTGNLKILLLFLNPFLFGNISKGDILQGGLGFFWENIGYPGLLTTPLALASLIIFKKRRSLILIFIAIALISLNLSLGKNGPLHIFFSIPPLNYFRIPPRFLFITIFSMGVLAGFALTKLEKQSRRSFLIGIISLSIIVFDIFFHWFNFNPYIPYEKFLQQPESARLLKLSHKYRISTLWADVYGLPSSTNSTQAKTWVERKDFYMNEFFIMHPNVNTIFSIPSSDLYTSLITRRLELYRNLYRGETKIIDPYNLLLTDNAIKLLKLQAVKYLISSIKLQNKNLKLIYEKSPAQNQNYYVYELLEPLERIRIVSKTTQVNNVQELMRAIVAKNFDLEKSIIVEEEIPEIVTGEGNKYSINHVNDKQNLISFNVRSEKEGYLILADSYYPGWKAYIDKKETKVFAANGNSRAIVIPQGEHDVKFIYRSTHLILGLAITLVGYLILGVFALKTLISKSK